MTVLEPGPGMGFFTPELARLVGASGRVIAVDVQPRMLDRLRKRLSKAQLDDKVDMRLAKPESMGITDLNGKVDFALAFAVLHEMPSANGFFRETYEALKPNGRVLMAEPAGHVSESLWDAELRAANSAGFVAVETPAIRGSRAVVFQKRTNIESV
jgi:ubiquinone/menaquinone biosynthesis C-methylase UbiE